MNYQIKLLLLIVSILGISGIINANPTAKWKFATGGPVYSSPACFNGYVYIGSDDGNLYCLDANSGVKIWEFKTEGIIRCRPAISNGNVYFASDDGYLYSISASSGVKNWSYNIGNKIDRVYPNPANLPGNAWDYLQSSPCLDSGMIYIGSGDHNLYAIDTTGNFKWKDTTKNIIRATPCVYKGNVYVGSWDGFIYSFKKTDGSLVWKYNTQGSVNPSPCIADSILFCGSRSYYFFALNANTGTFYWKYLLNSSWVESSATYANGLVHVGSSDFRYVTTFRVSDSLKVAWRSSVPGDTWSSPVYDNGMVYIGLASYKGDFNTQAGGGLLALNSSTGKIEWRLDCGTTPFIGGVASSPTVFNNVVFYGSIDSNVYAAENTIAGVDNEKVNQRIPDIYSLANYPNPFNPSTTISYDIPVSGNISIKIYNILGEEVATVFQGFKKAGNYTANFDASKLKSGVYLYRLQAGGFSVAKKMILIK